MKPERLIRLGASAFLIGSTALSSGCGREFSTYSTEVPKTVSLDSPRLQWEIIPPLQRLQKILSREYPPILGFDPRKETTLASAQAYCQNTYCNVSPEEMAKAVEYLDEDRFIKELVKAENFDQPLTREIIEMEKQSRLAITTQEGKIYINQKLADRIAANIANNRSDETNQLGNNDIATTLQISTENHERTHKNGINPVEHFDPFFIRTPTEGAVTFNTLNGFVLEGKNSNGKPKFIVGGNESIIDFAAYIITEKEMGIKYLSPAEYTSGRLLVEKLNKMADIPDEEFLRYVNGQLRPHDLLKKWGKFKRDQSLSDFQAGILALRNIGIAVQGIISFKDAEIDTNRILKLEKR